MVWKNAETGYDFIATIGQQILLRKLLFLHFLWSVAISECRIFISVALAHSSLLVSGSGDCTPILQE